MLVVEEAVVEEEVGKRRRVEGSCSWCCYSMRWGYRRRVWKRRGLTRRMRSEAEVAGWEGSTLWCWTW